MTDRLTDADAFLERSAEVLDDVPEPLAACAWCAHPLDDASPSGEFCRERCASDWRAGLDWTDEERCACRTCDPQGYAARGTIWTERRDYSMDECLAMVDRLRGRIVARSVRPRTWTVGPMDEAPALRELSGWTDMGYVSAEPVITWTNAYDEPGLRDLSHDLPPAPRGPWIDGAVASAVDREPDPG